MPAGWYIVTYHNVDWEDSVLTRAIGGTTRPDVFREHLDRYAARGEIIAVEEGLRRLQAGKRLHRPAISLWFDDGFAGVVKYALPICREHGITAAVAINSRFVLRQEMFWRSQLAYLVATNRLQHLRCRISGEGWGTPERLKGWTVEHFSHKLRRIIDDLYEEFTSQEFRRDAFRVFADEDGISKLMREGWLITNHSAAHYPLTVEQGWPAVEGCFRECESLVRHFNPQNGFWVLPFGHAVEYYLSQLAERATIVAGRSRANTPTTVLTRMLYRLDAPASRAVPRFK